jgi:hypothetical protein
VARGATVQGARAAHQNHQTRGFRGCYVFQYQLHVLENSGITPVVHWDVIGNISPVIIKLSSSVIENRFSIT